MEYSWSLPFLYYRIRPLDSSNAWRLSRGAPCTLTLARASPASPPSVPTRYANVLVIFHCIRQISSNLVIFWYFDTFECFPFYIRSRFCRVVCSCFVIFQWSKVLPSAIRFALFFSHVNVAVSTILSFSNDIAIFRVASLRMILFDVLFVFCHANVFFSSSLFRCFGVAVSIAWQS